MINNPNLLSPVGKPTKVRGLDGHCAGHLVYRKGIIEVTVARRLRKQQGRM